MLFPNLFFGKSDLSVVGVVGKFFTLYCFGSNFVLLVVISHVLFLLVVDLDVPFLYLLGQSCMGRIVKFDRYFADVAHHICCQV